MTDIRPIMDRLARVSDETLDGQPSTDTARDLFASIVAGDITPAIEAADEIAARHTRRGKARLAVAAVLVVCTATAIAVLGPGLIGDGMGGATSYANSAITVDREGDFFVARIKDPLADHARYAEAFHAIGLDVDIELVPVSSKLVGQLIASSNGGRGGSSNGSGGATVMTEVVSSGPEPVDCAREPTRCTIVIRIAAESTGWMRFTVGRRARPGEAYNDCAPPSGCPGRPGGKATPGSTPTSGTGSKAAGGGR